MTDDLTPNYPPADLQFQNAILQQAHSHILEYGLHVQAVLPLASDPNPEPGWVYTIGLNALDGLPDLIVSGLPSQLAQTLLNSLARQLRNGSVELPRDLNVDLHTVLQGFPARLRAVHSSQHDDHVGMALAYQATLDHLPGRSGQATALRFVQLLLPDREGRFPGEPDVSPSWDAATLLLDQPTGSGTSTPNPLA